MKLCIAALLPLVATAFAPSFGVRPSSTTVLNVEVRPDTADLTAKAMAASKEFGPTSREARLAWETVEEMDASTNLRYVRAKGSQRVLWGDVLSAFLLLRKDLLSYIENRAPPQTDLHLGLLEADQLTMQR